MFREILCFGHTVRLKIKCKVLQEKGEKKKCFHGNRIQIQSKDQKESE